MHQRSESSNQFGTVLQFLGLSTLAIAVPLFDTLGEGATFFIAHNLSALELVGFTLAVYLFVPLAAWLFVTLIGLICGRAGAFAQRVLLAGLAALWVMGLMSPLPIVAGVIGGLSTALAVAWGWRRQGFQTLLTYLGLASLLAPLTFLLLSPVRSLLTAGEGTVGTRLATDTPVVMLVLDELSLPAMLTPTGEIDVARLPGFGRLASLATWYSNTTTVSTETQRAVPAILTGQRPVAESLPLYQDFPQNIFSLLGSTHAIRAVETGTRLCPPVVCKPESVPRRESADFVSDLAVVYLHTLLPLDLARRWLPPLNSRWRDFRSADDQADQEAGKARAFGALAIDVSLDPKRRFEKFRDGFPLPQKASFSYLHLALPHVPWLYLPDGSVYNGHSMAGQTTASYSWGAEQSLVEQGLLRYALQIEYTDRLLGELLGTLANDPYWEETLLVVVADHGLAFAPGMGRRAVVAETLAEVGMVPLFIKFPGQAAPARVREPVETIDILPTLAEVLGASLVEPVDGRSLLSNGRARSTRGLYEARDDSVDFERDLNLKRAIKRFTRVVKPGESALGSLAQGAARDLAGRSEARLPVVGEAGLKLVLDRPEWYGQARTQGKFVPVRLTGTVAGAKSGTPLIIGLGGEIVATGETWGDSGEFSLMLPPASLRAGVPRFSGYIEIEGELRRLAMDQAPRPYSLEFAESGELRSVALGEQAWQQTTGASGFAGKSKYTAIRYISGWAWDSAAGKPPVEVLLLRGEQLVGDGFIMLENPLQASQLGADPGSRLWFSMMLGHGQWPQSEAFSVVALFADGGFLRLSLK